MARIRGFLLKHRVKTLFQQVHFKPLPCFMKWANRLRAKAKTILCKKHEPVIRLGQEPVLVPKGQMAVYVGQKDGDYKRIIVPVVYFNHPLFGDLLKESEKEFGFDHQGGITIPCRVSEFERVQTRIQAVQSPRRFLTWKGSHRSLMA